MLNFKSKCQDTSCKQFIQHCCKNKIQSIHHNNVDEILDIIDLESMIPLDLCMSIHQYFSRHHHIDQTIYMKGF